MKKIFTFVLALALCAGMSFAQESGGADIEESYSPLVRSIPSNENGMLAVQYDPFGPHEVDLLGAFRLAGPWHMEVILGLLDFGGDFAVNLGIDAVNFKWAFFISESISWNIGAGAPLYVHLPEFDIGINPHGQLGITFFENSVPLTVYARPGARISFHGEGAKFTCPFGAGISIPGDTLQNIVSSFFGVFSAAM